MRVLVSGGSGLVGRYVVNGLQEAGWDVAVGGRSKPPAGWFSGPASFVPLLLDPTLDQSDAFRGIDAFVHAAFDHLPGRYRGGEGNDPDGFRRRNLEGSVRLFETARKAGVRRLVFLSSRAVYDGLREGDALDEGALLSPTSLYGQVKLAAERALAELDAPGFTTASLRLTGVYGDLRPNKWDTLIADYLAGRPVVSRAGSEVHGGDVAQAVRLVLETDEAHIRADRAYNVSDIVTDTHAILAEVKRMTGAPHPLPPEADTAQVAAMPTGRIRALGWQPGSLPLLAATVERVARSWVAP